jgi:predicted phosphodiesterase
MIVNGEEYLPLREAAARLGVPENTLRGQRWRGKIKTKKLRGSKHHLYCVGPAQKTEEKVKPRKSSSSVYKVVSLWDVHVPDADAFAFKAVLDFIKDYQPDHVVLGGDFLELESCSTHGGVANPLALTDEIKAGKKALSRIKDCAPNAAITYLEGNHERRLNRVVISSLPTFDGAIDIPSMLCLDDIDVEWVPYRQLWRPNINGIMGKLAYTHGEWATMHHANKHLQQYGCSVRYGHTHRPQSATRGYADGRVCIAIGSPCLRTLDVGWAGPHHGWLHGFGVDEFMPDGTFTSQNVIMSDRKFAWNGRIYG